MELRKFDRFSKLEVEALALLREHMTAATEIPHAVMLTGGRTPLGLYRHIEQRPFKVDAGLHVLLSDERYVTVESPESNFGRMSGMLRALGVPDEGILRVRTEHPFEDAVERYDRALRDFFSRGGAVTLGILGLGADGHVASLFSIEDVWRGEGRFAIGIETENGPARISVTRELLQRVDRIVFLVHGRDKNEAVQRLLTRPDSIPAGVALAGREDVQVWYCSRDS